MDSKHIVPRWRTSAVVAIGLWIASTCAPVQAAMITWKSDWTKDKWWDNTRPLPNGVDLAKEVFGADSANDMQISGQDKMPAIGKAAVKIHRIANFTTIKEGGVFTRQFMLDEDAQLRLTASIKGKFVATGTFIVGNETDFLNATDSISVKGVGGSGTAFYQLGAPKLTAGTYPVNPDPKTDTEKSNVVDLTKGTLYTLVFDFSTDVQLTGGKDGKPGASLESAFFDTFIGDVSLVPSPEPSAFILFGLGSLGSVGYGWWRRKWIA
jgi:hypothetical protein